MEYNVGYFTLRLKALFSLSAVLFFSALMAESSLPDQFLADVEKWSGDVKAVLENFADYRFAVSSDGKVLTSNSDKLSFQEFKVWEQRLYFSETALDRIELYLYNKGDAGELEKEEFKNLIDKICARLEQISGSRGVTGKVSNDRPNYYVNRRSWKVGDVGVQIEWAFVNAHRSNRVMVPFRAEFVKAVLTPVRAGSLTGRPSVKPDWAKLVSGRHLLKNVEQNGAGDVWVTGIPMVDQGQKGYCAAASAERVLRYYGWQGDQHEIAQLADTAAQGGTSLEGMVAAISVVGKRYQLSSRTLLDPSSGGSFEKSGFNKLIEQYNRAAKSVDAEIIDPMDYCDTLPNNVKLINIMSIFEVMNIDILKEARLSRTQEYQRFQQDVQAYVRQGVPLFWACVVGKISETPALSVSGAFGHIRLIIGFNARENELLYSDSWGAGHALKRIKVDDAWTMTFGLTVLKPRDVR